MPSSEVADVLVIGAGASGAGFTWSLTQAGIKVVCGAASTPLSAARGSVDGNSVPWGLTHHQTLNERLSHAVAIMIVAEDLPEEHNQVILDPELTGSHGIPAPEVQYTISENTGKMLAHGVEMASQVMETAGAREVFVSFLERNAGAHLLGTARMGGDPTTSVVDRWGRSHDFPNLFLIDGSVFVTAASVNPTPTIQALSLRTADYLKGEGKDATG